MCLILIEALVDPLLSLLMETAFVSPGYQVIELALLGDPVRN